MKLRISTGIAGINRRYSDIICIHYNIITTITYFSVNYLIFDLKPEILGYCCCNMKHKLLIIALSTNLLKLSTAATTTVKTDDQVHNENMRRL